MQGLGFGVSRDNVRVGRDGCLHFWVDKVNDLSVFLKEIDLFNSRNVGGTQLFEGRTELDV